MRILPVVTLVGILTLIGTTFAFYADRASYNNSLQLAADTATFVDTFDAPEDWTPCTETPKTATATNTNEEERWVRMKIDEYWRTADSQTSADDHTTSDLPLSWTDNSGTHRYTIINTQNTEAWARGDDGWFYYRTALAKDETTLSYLESVTFNCEVNLAGEVRYSVDGKTAESIPSDYANAQYHVYVTFEMTNHEYEYDELPENIVARIERTQKLYGSIMAAEAKAEAGDTITLLTNTEEVVTNEKQVTLDLNNHTVTGSLTNTPAGNLTLINGEINNPNGVAVINNGTLTLGINDYDPDTGVANIINDNIRLVGTTAALQQTNDSYKLYYYDGYLEGDVGMIGGYDGAPMYHRYADVQDVYFWPYVYQRQTADEHKYQHVELRSADNAVSKTSVHGDIYYMDLQDNINTSIMTGYKIYAVNDYPIFSASYDITIPSGAIIEFDLVGHDIRWNNLTVVNGDFIIYDSNSTTDPTTCETTYAGEISFQQTITGTGTLRLDHSKLSNTVNSNTLMNFGGKLIMQNAALYTYSGHALTSVTGATYDVDACSTITTNRSNSTIYNTITDFVWDTGGKISNNNSYAFENTASASATLKGGVWNSPTSIVSRDGAPITIDGATISSTDVGISGGTITMKSGSINVNAYSGWHYGITSGYTMNLTGGTINVVSTGGNAVGVNFGAWYSSQTSLTLDGTTINANTTRNNPAFGVRVSMLYCDETQTNAAVLNVKSGNITSTSDTGTGYGIYSESPNTHIEGGTIYGDTYGIYSSTNKCPITIGKNDNALSTTTPTILSEGYGLYSGAFKFYDGIVKGNTGAYQSGIIQAVPDGTKVHDDTDAEYAYAAWLENGANYLRVNNTEYNALTKAYNAITGNTGTIYVIDDVTIDTDLPASPTGKDITIDLQGHDLAYSQTLVVSPDSTINIADSVGGGILRNTSSLRYTIQNSGTLNIDSGTVYHQTNTAIYNHAADSGNAIVNVTGGTVKCVTICIYNLGSRDSSRNEHYSGTNITGGEILIDEPSNSAQYGLYVYDYALKPSITGGRIRIERNSGTGDAIGIYTRAYDVNIDTGTNNDAIIINTPTSSATGVYNEWTAVNLNSGNISVTGGGTMTGIRASGIATISPNGKVIVTNTGSGAAIGTYAGTNKMEGGSVSATAISGNAVGTQFCGPGRNTTLNSGSIYAYSESGLSKGAAVAGSDCSRNYFYINGGTITAETQSGTAYGAYIGNTWSTITAGKIQGDNYGVYNFFSGSSANYTDVIGVSGGTPDITTPEIIGGQYGYYGGDIYFYDGVLRGTKSYQEGAIKAIPDSYTYHTEPSADYAENTWLVRAADYLSVNGQPYNSLADAYAAITGNSGTIYVTDDVLVEAVLPSLPANKNITFDLNGHQLTYTQPLLVNGSGSTFTIVDSDPNGTDTGFLHNSDPTKVTISHANNSALNINSGKISGTGTTISTSGNASWPLNINGGTIECDGTCIIGDSTININGGLITAKNISSGSQTLIDGWNTDVNITGGQLRIVRPSDSTNTGSATAIEGSRITINTNNSNTPIVYIDAPTATVYAFNNSKAAVTDSSIYLNGNNAYSFTTEGGHRLYSLNNTTVDVNAVNDAYGIYNGEVYIDSNSTVTASSTNGSAYGAYFLGHWGGSRANIHLNGGTITATSANGNAYGAYGNSSEGVGGDLYVTDGVLSSSAPNGTSYGVYTAVAVDTVNITGGTVSGVDYGTYAAFYGNSYSTFTIGTDDGTIDDNSPVIIGGEYGIYNGNVTMSDGRLKGAIAAHYNRNIKYLPTDAVLHADTEVISGTTYHVEYLVAAHNVAQIVGGSGYNRLDLAIANATSGSTIELLEDNYLYYDLTFPADKTLTIDTKGYDIIPINPIVNNGDVTIVNNGSTASTIDFIETGYAITNNAGASLTLNNINLTASKVIDNQSTLALDKTSIVASDVAVKNTGVASVSNGSSLDGTNYAFYSTSGNNTITGSTIANGQIYSSDGSIALTNGSATVPSNGKTAPNTLISNGASSTISLNSFPITYSNPIDGQAIYNDGTLDISNDSDIAQTNGNIIIYNHAGTSTATIADSDLSLISPDGRWSGTGIYNPSGTVTMPTGSITISNYNYATGISNGSGVVTLGVAEPTSSPDRGQATAHVDNTNPSIRAIGASTGTAITFDTGQVYFYDGIATGSTSAINKDPSVIEYLWRAKYGTDGDGYHYMIQEFAQN